MKRQFIVHTFIMPRSNSEYHFHINSRLKIIKDQYYPFVKYSFSFYMNNNGYSKLTFICKRIQRLI